MAEELSEEEDGMSVPKEPSSRESDIDGDLRSEGLKSIDSLKDLETYVMETNGLGTENINEPWHV